MWREGWSRGGGTNQQPSGKSNFPHPRERTRAAALEETGLEPCDCPRCSLAAGASAHNVARRRGDGEEARDSGTCVRVGVETCLGYGNVLGVEGCRVGRRNSAKPEGGNHLQKQPRSLEEVHLKALCIGHCACAVLKSPSPAWFLTPLLTKHRP